MNNASYYTGWIFNTYCSVFGDILPKSFGPFDFPMNSPYTVFNVVKSIPSNTLNIFMTESTYSGALGGESGANEKCQSDNYNPLGAGTGTWKAALYNNNPVFTVGESYTLWSALQKESVTYIPSGTDVSIESAWITPLALSPTQNYAWINSKAAPTQHSCNNWATDSAGVGHKGNGIGFDTAEISINAATDCSHSATFHLICIQQ